MKTLSAITLVALLLSGSAWARPIHDYSMSPEESLRQGNSHKGRPSGNYHQFWNHNQTQSGGQYNRYNDMGRYNSRSSNYNTQLPDQPASQFMTGFCDPNFKPLLANSGRIASLNACLDDQKKQACDRFGSLPNDVQKEMDKVIGCLYNASNNGQMDENGSIQQAPQQDCTRDDAVRLDMLKQYWSDQNVAYAILFLPDMVLGGAARCMGGS